MAKKISFSKALDALKKGSKVQREGWNGKGMWLALQKGYPQGTPCNKNSSEAYGIEEGVIIKVLPYIVMKTVDDSFVPWLASQTDILAEDWIIILDKK